MWTHKCISNKGDKMNVLQGLLTPERLSMELPGILNWAIKGNHIYTDQNERSDTQ